MQELEGKPEECCTGHLHWAYLRLVLSTIGYGWGPSLPTKILATERSNPGSIVIVFSCELNGEPPRL